MQYWLLKTEPETWSWQQQINAKTSMWDGIRNYQARNYLQLMQINDLAFFYHTGLQKQIMGLVKIIKTAYPDPKDNNFYCVDVEYIKSFNNPVTLQLLKFHPVLQNLKIIKQSRLSVSPVDTKHANLIIALGN